MWPKKEEEFGRQAKGTGGKQRLPHRRRKPVDQDNLSKLYAALKNGLFERINALYDVV
ncbi:MAG: hypothetical protein HKO71_04430 [Pseudomonadales bacterium]|nr:hypothetical protein [Pseudomonadales bacterium]